MGPWALACKLTESARLPMCYFSTFICMRGRRYMVSPFFSRGHQYLKSFQARVAVAWPDQNGSMIPCSNRSWVWYLVPGTRGAWEAVFQINVPAFCSRLRTVPHQILYTGQRRLLHTAVETWLPSWGPNLAKPKSDSFAFQFSSRRMFDGFRSLNIIWQKRENYYDPTFVRHQD